MNRTEKQQEIEKLQGEFAEIQHAFLVDYKGVTVPRVSQLRRQVQEAGAHYRVIKNSLFSRAVGDLPLGGLSEHIKGPTAVAWHDSDPLPLAKVLRDFAVANPVFEVKAVLIDGQTLPGDSLAELASLPGLEQLQAQLAYVLASPMRRLATALASPSRGLASVIKQKAEKSE